MVGRKFSDQKVRAARHLWATGEFTQREIREWMGISATHCQKVLAGQRRAMAGGPINEGPETRERRKEISDQEVEEIRKKFARGTASQGELANEFGVTRGYISHLVRGTARKDAGGPVRGRDYEEPGE